MREKQRLEDWRTGDSLEKRARRARQGGPPPEAGPSRTQMGFEVMGDPGCVSTASRSAALVARGGDRE
jgi:hypothetical protein